MRPPAGASSPTPTRLIFRPRPTLPRAGEEERFHLRLLDSLRAGAGLSVAFRLEWRTGRGGGIRLAVRGPRARAWMQSELTGAYGIGLWEAWEDPPNGETPLLFGRPADPPAPPIGHPPPRGAWSDIVVASLPSFPQGLTVGFELEPRSHPGQKAHVPSRPLDPPSPSPLQRRAAPTRYELEIREAAERRRAAPLWAARILVATSGERCSAALEASAGRLARLVTLASRSEGGNAIEFRRRSRWSREGGPPALLSETEVVGLLPTPWTRLPRFPLWTAPGCRVPGWKRREGSLPPVAQNEGRHLLILGETGMGKSSLLTELALRGMEEGAVVLFDPVGDTARRFLAAVPAECEPRVTWISPSDSPVGWNALAAAVRERPGTSLSERALGDLVLALQRVRSSRYADASYWGPRIEEMVSLALRAAAAWPRGTILLAERLLDPRGRVGAVPPQAADAYVVLRERLDARPEDGEGARRLLGEVGRHEMLRRLLADGEARWSLDQAVGGRSVLVISGEAPSVGESVARYLLSVYLALLWPTLLARARPEKVFVCLDEVQWYAHEGIGEMLRLARRFNVHLYAATQALRSLPEEVRDAFLTNAADFALFRGSPDEAREFARWSPLVDPQRLLGLSQGRGILLCGKAGEVSEVIARVVPPSPDAPGRIERLRERCRPLWSTAAPSPGAGRPDGPAAAAAPATAEAARLRAILRAIATRDATAESLSIDLEGVRKLRPELAPALRALGGELRAEGILLERRRAEGGAAAWRLRAEPLRSGAGLPENAAPDPGVAAEAERWLAEGVARLRRQGF